MAENSENIDKFNKSAEAAANRIDNLKNKLGELNKASETVGSGFDGFLFSSKALSKTLSENKDALEKIKSGQMGINEAEKLQQKISKQTADLQGRKEQLQKKLLGGSSKLTDAQKTEVKAALIGMDKKIKASKNLGQEALKAAGGGTKFGTAMAKTKGVLGKLSGGFKGVNKDVGSFSTAFMSMGKKGGAGLLGTLGKAGKLLKVLGKNPLLLVLSAFAKLGKALVKMQDESTALGRELGVSAANASKVKEFFIDVAKTTQISVKRTAALQVQYREIAAANSSINKALGLQLVYSEDITRFAAQATKYYGFTIEQSANLAKLAIARDKTSESIYKLAVAGSYEAGTELGTRIQGNEVAKETLSITGQLRAMYIFNTKELANSVAKAKALGTTLANIKSSSRELLNFQSSISAEMEAELFTGKQLNLDRLRALALVGDYSQYQNELIKQLPPMVEFARMNVFQQEKLAAAYGMSADAISDILVSKMTLGELQQAQINASSEEEAAMYGQLSLQQKYNNALEKMQYLLINFVAKLESKIANGRMPRLLRWLGFEAGEDLFDSGEVDTSDTLDEVGFTAAGKAGDGGSNTLGTVMEKPAGSTSITYDPMYDQELAQKIIDGLDQINKTTAETKNINVKTNYSAFDVYGSTYGDPYIFYGPKF